jgi:hypothetical protein
MINLLDSDLVTGGPEIMTLILFLELLNGAMETINK